jgi:hypothetical protein
MTDGEDDAKYENIMALDVAFHIPNSLLLLNFNADSRAPNKIEKLLGDALWR